MLNELKRRNVPDLLTFSDGTAVCTVTDWQKRRQEIEDIFQKEMYGKIPNRPRSLSFNTTSRKEDKRFCAGKASLTKTDITCTLENGTFTFPLYCAVPVKKPKLTFLHINFRDCVPDKYMPTEELIDNGCAVFSFCYKDITSDDNDFTNGLAGVLFPDGRRTGNDSGKIAMWAWAAMRAMDYIQTLDCIDKEKVVVIGHSRLGKTALLTSAFDNRFFAAVSNNSGCCGAAIEREKAGERYENIFSKFPFWFCPDFEKYANGSSEFPVDQHALIALSAPRYVCVGSAKEDIWADPESEFLACVGASAVYELYGKRGFIHDNAYPTAPSALQKGDISYHVREGVHYLSRTDWLYYLKYFQG